MPTLFSGLLRLHGEDIAILQRLFDPLAITLLFIAFNASSLTPPPEGGIPPWCWVALCVVVLLRRAGIYASYRSLSLFTLARPVSYTHLTLPTTVFV